MQVATPVALRPAAPEQADDVDGLFQHLEPHVGGRPTLAYHVLVQVLTRTDSERETTVGQHRHSGGGLGHDGRVVADEGTGDGGHQVQLLGALRHRPQHGPSEGAVALSLEPGMKVVGHHGELETGVLGELCLPNQVVWCALLGH